MYMGVCVCVHARACVNSYAWPTAFHSLAHTHARAHTRTTHARTKYPRHLLPHTHTHTPPTISRRQKDRWTVGSARWRAAKCIVEMHWGHMWDITGCQGARKNLHAMNATRKRICTAVARYGAWRPSVGIVSAGEMHAKLVREGADSGTRQAQYPKIHLGTK